MKALTENGFEQARSFMEREARPLERALFRYHFLGASADEALVELARFGNADGGFGHGLEADVRCPESSALATGIALVHLRELGCPADHPLVAGAIGYLWRTLDEERGIWRALPPQANDAPHAPWWDDEDGSLAQTFDDFLVVPRAQIVALLHYTGVVEGGRLAELTDRTIDEIIAAGDEIFGGGGDALVYAQRLLGIAGLAEERRVALRAHLEAAAAQYVSFDPAEWGGYCAAPLKVAPTPEMPLAGLLAEALPLHLDWVIGQQSAAGSWEPNWSWGGWYPAEWERARQEWRGVRTLETLLTLRAYGRLAV